jgi:hypothetical protein
LAQSANLDLEKKVVELADALKKCQDEKKIAEYGKKIAKKPSRVLKNILKSCKRFMMKI